MKQSMTRWFSLGVVSSSLLMMLTSSCGRAPLETLEEPSGTVDVTGAFFDWTPATASYAGGIFLLIDPLTNEVFKSDLMEKDKSSFKIEKVPVSGRYYGVLLDKKFEPKAFLQKTNSDSKQMRVFKLGTTGGNLGTVVVRDTRLESSQHAELEFQTPYGAGDLTEKIFASEYSTTFTHNPDIDSDGIPNIIDINVDGDSLQNIFDASTYAGKTVKVADSSIPAAFNYGYGISKSGYFKCDHLRTPTSKDNSAFNLSFSCGLKLPAGSSEKVTLLTTKVFTDNSKNHDGSATFDWQMRDDGTAGDLIANDGLWTAKFTLPASTESPENQTILATAKMKDGSVKSYITTLEPDIALTEKGIDALAAFTVDDNLKLSFEVSKLETNEGFQISATVMKESDDSVVHIFTGKLDNAKEHSFKNVDDFLLKTPEKYRVLIKITGPAALPGLPGSAFEIYSGALDFPAVATP